MITSDILLLPSRDYESMIRLGREAGLEMRHLGPVESGFGLFDSGLLVGCVCLVREQGEHILDCLAVLGSLRGKGLGTRLVQAAEEEARARGALRVLAVARSPGFFVKIGYRVARPGEVLYPSVSGCDGCPQFGTTCSPAVMVKYL